MQKAEDRVLELSRLDDDKLESKVEMDKKVERSSMQITRI